MTELQTLKKKKKEGKASPEELTRLKLLQDGEPLSKADLEESKKREEDRKVKDKEEFDAKKHKSQKIPGSFVVESPSLDILEDIHRRSLDPTPEHPRIVSIKAALEPFTKIDAHDSRPDEFVLFTRGTTITAGDVRKARRAMKL